MHRDNKVHVKVCWFPLPVMTISLLSLVVWILIAIPIVFCLSEPLSVTRDWHPDGRQQIDHCHSPFQPFGPGWSPFSLSGGKVFLRVSVWMLHVCSYKCLCFLLIVCQSLKAKHYQSCLWYFFNIDETGNILTFLLLYKTCHDKCLLPTIDYTVTKDRANNDTAGSLCNDSKVKAWSHG